MSTPAPPPPRPGSGPFLVPSSVPTALVEVGKELSRTEERARYSAQGQFETSKQWRSVNLWLGGSTSAMSALAAVLTFASNGLQVWAGGAAITAAILAAVMTTVAPERRSSRAQQAANSYLAIQTEARQYLLLHLAASQHDEAVATVRRLSQALDETNRSADPPGKRARVRSSEVIHGGGQVYGVDEA